MRRLSALLVAVTLLFGLQLYLDRRGFMSDTARMMDLGSEIMTDWTGRTFELADGLMAATDAAMRAVPWRDDRNFDRQSVSAILHRAIGTTEAVVEIAVYNGAGTRLFVTGDAGHLPGLLTSPDWRIPPKPAGEGQPATAKPYRDVHGDSLILLGRAGPADTMIVAAVSPDYLAAAYRRIMRRTHSIATLSDDSGRVLARTHADSLAFGSAPEGSIAEADRHLAIPGDDDTRMVSTRSLPELGVSITLTASRHEISVLWLQSQLLPIAMFGVVMTVLLMGTIAFHRRLLDIERNRAALHDARTRATEAGEAKSRFLAMMSHELRTPMSGMIGTLDLLRETPLTPQQTELVRVLATSSSALLEVLNDILDFSKIEAGAITVEEADFSLEDVVGSTIDLFRARCEQKRIRLHHSVEDGVPRYLTGDAVRIRQVLTNLVGNAAKFTENGTIRIDVGLYGDKPAQGSRSVTLLFSVQDTGVGISSATQALLFEPFVQADASTARRYGGTGLGLAICRRLVQAMGGQIGLTSAIGNGSRFWFTLPLGIAKTAPRPLPQPAPEPPAPAPAPGTRRPRVLVAEDNDINRFLIREQLQRRGYDVTSVENGWQAVEEQRRNAHDIILLDMRMPVMDGPTALAHIRAIEGPAGLRPVVALTADALPTEIEGYIRTGVDALHTKPVDWPALDACLRRLLDQDVPRFAAPGEARAQAPTGKAAPLPAALKTLGSANPAFDPAPVEELRDVMTDDAIRDLVVSFRMTLMKESATLRAAALAGDAAHLREAAHTIQGMAAQLGAQGVADIARTIRLDGSTPIAPDELGPRLDLYDRVVDATLVRLDALTSRGAA